MRPTIEQQYYLPLYRRLQDSQSFRSVGILAESETPDLVITGERTYHASLPSADVRLVRPRKITAFEDLHDLYQLKFRVADGPGSQISFEPMTSKKFVSLKSLTEELANLPELQFWGEETHIPISDVVLSGKVVHGFGRGSKQLGVPTANIEMTADNVCKTEGLIPGVYSATAALCGKTYRCAMSIGWNPVYDNEQKTIEAYLITDNLGEFYGENLEV